MTELKLIPQREWLGILAESGASVDFLCEHAQIQKRAIYDYIHGKRQPKTNNLKKMQEVLKIAMQVKRLEKHPSYGYATKEQIEKLETLGICPERTRILEQIKYQNENNGKVK